jgi:hypothetical protein
MRAFAVNYDVFREKLQNFCFVSSFGFLIFCVAPSKSWALTVSTGLSAVEEQDSRLRPAASLFVQAAGNWEGSASFYGQDFSGVSQRNFLLGVYKSANIFNTKILSAGVGFAALTDTTTFEEAPEDNHTNVNAGVTALIRAETDPKQKFYAAASWQSHIFPAGLATIFLVTARRQIISISAGVRL